MKTKVTRKSLLDYRVPTYVELNLVFVLIAIGYFGPQGPHMHRD